MPSFISRCVTGEVNVEGGVQTRLIEHLVHAVTKSEETTRLQHVSKVVSPVYFQDVLRAVTSVMESASRFLLKVYRIYESLPHQIRLPSFNHLSSHRDITHSRHQELADLHSGIL
jgi:hypothetical protein